ncbi:MAG TPA: right-handed parallel beta-helix repeat-containing protein [Gemmataceae bacterium]|nr:right-handed parallel beta-helix repeat-containing protein [Gemmataceae bacterium]
MSHTWWSPLGKRKGRASGRARTPTFIARLEALEDRSLLTTLVVSPGGIVPGSFSSIQAAVNAAANSGDTVQVDPGTYTEQVTINKSLTVEGNGAGAVIQAPGTLTSHLGQTALVEIGGGATVNMSALALEGPGPSAGIYVVGGATANVTGTVIDKMRQNPLNGVQTGRGILVGSTGQSQVGHATITGCTITEYQKSGIVTGGNGTTVTVTGTTITGVGPTPLIAQNGIGINTGTTATISTNTISGNQFTGTNSGPNPTTNTQSAGILIDGSAPTFPGGVVTVSNNTVSGNDVGINSISNSFTVTISGNTVQGNLEGLVLQEGTAAVSNNNITGNNIGVAVIAFALDSFGTPVTTDAQATLVSNNININGNRVPAFPGGGISLLIAPGATTTARATVNFNRIVGNEVALNNTTFTRVDATNNFWGSNDGPGGIDNMVGGPVTFNPWLVLQVTASPTSVMVGGVATVVASLTTNNAGTDTSALGHLPDGIPVSFSTTSGTIVPTTGFTAAGEAAAQFTAGNTAGAATVSATVDNQTSTATITVTSPVIPVRKAATVGVFDQATQTWYLRGSNSAGPPAAGQFRYGTATSVPVSGNWTGSADTIGVFDQNTFTWFLRNEDSAGPPDAGQFQFGGQGWLPVTGDWNNSGHTGVGAFDPATQTWYLRNEANAGPPDAGQFRFGVAGGIPVVGDWTGTGHLGIGIFDPATATWYLRSTASAGLPDVGVFRYGGIGWRPVAGDWTGAGHAGIGAFDPSTAVFSLRTEPTAGPPDAGQFAFGGQHFEPVAGLFPPLAQLLTAAGGEGPGGATPLSAARLQSAVAGALARLTGAGIDPGLVQSLAAARFAVGALPDGVLGETDAAGRLVVLSTDAAGHGWFADGTPLADEEFAPGAAGSPLVALPGSPAAGKEDLLTAVLHEMGHLAGRPDGDAGLMAGALGLGTRDLGALDQVFAGPSARGLAL